MGHTWVARLGLWVAPALITGACAGGTLAPGALAGTETPAIAPTPAQAPPTVVMVATSAADATGVATEVTIPAALPVPTSQPAANSTEIRVTIGESVLTGRLWDNATAHDLLAQLPLTLTFSDYNGLEKIARLPGALSTEGAPAGDNPLPSDIGYYAPWSNLVFYYGDVGNFSGIVRIGQFDGSMDALVHQTSDFTATIEIVN